MIKKLKNKIKDVEKAIMETEINMATSEYLLNLFKLHDMLWNLCYFKKNMEEHYLDPSKEDKEK